MAHHEHEEKHLVGYGTYISIWLGLVILTGLTVAVSGVNLNKLAVVTAILIAAFKTGLVLAYFMHLKYESLLLRLMFSAAVLTLAVSIGLTFFDVLYR